MTEVCLVNPPSGFLLDERVFMPLGILHVGSALELKGIKVSALDLGGVSNYLEAVVDYVRSTDVRTFGITATTPQLPAATLISKMIHSVRKDARVILGGPHVTGVNTALKRHLKQGRVGRSRDSMNQLQDFFDVLVAGDGEEAIFEAISVNAPKLVDADEPKSHLFLSNKNLEESPLPARHLLDVDSYRYLIDGERALQLQAQRGCPFGCNFCSLRYSPSFRRVRTRSSENVVSEMLHLHKTYGVNGFMFYDDELNINTKMIELMELITKTQRDLGVKWSLRGFVKAELFTEAQAVAMREAGFKWILVGFESGSPRILKNINKKATREDNSRCMEIARRAGLKVKALMTLGHPGDSLDTVRETKEWLLEVRPDDFDVASITVYPGTPYYDDAVQGEFGYVYTCPNGDRLHQVEIDFAQVASYYKGNPDGGYHSYVFTDYLTAEDLVWERDNLERTVRVKLDIPFNTSRPAMLYEHSMGQSGTFPRNLLRSSNT